MMKRDGRTDIFINDAAQPNILVARKSCYARLNAARFRALPCLAFSLYLDELQRR